jgi:hypothetical protein
MYIYGLAGGLFVWAVLYGMETAPVNSQRRCPVDFCDFAQVS